MRHNGKNQGNLAWRRNNKIKASIIAHEILGSIWIYSEVVESTPGWPLVRHLKRESSY